MSVLPKVSICVPLYNAEKYLPACLDSLLAQKCDFPFEIIVSDDCSTDRSREILTDYAARYPDRIVSLFQKCNLGAVGNFCSGIQQARGEYVACCDCDDFWNDPAKLQMQVALLDANPQAVLCYANMQVLEDRTGEIQPSGISKGKTKPETGMVYEELMQVCFIGALTVCARAEDARQALMEIDLANQPEWLSPDYPLWLALSLKGEFIYLDRVVSTYRNRVESVSVSSDKSKRTAFKYGNWKVIEYFLKKRDVSPEIRKKLIARGGDLTVFYFFYNRKFDALRKFVSESGDLAIKSGRAKLIKACRFSDAILNVLLKIYIL